MYRVHFTVSKLLEARAFPETLSPPRGAGKIVQGARPRAAAASFSGRQGHPWAHTSFDQLASVGIYQD